MGLSRTFSEPNHSSLGCAEARVLLSKQEAELLRLRDAKEAEVVAELNRARSELETEGRLTQLGKLCATPFGIDVVGITEFVALIGALVGGARPPPPPLCGRHKLAARPLRLYPLGLWSCGNRTALFMPP